MKKKRSSKNQTRKSTYRKSGGSGPETSSIPANRNIKDSLFRGVFNKPEELLSLYNAVSGRNYTDPSELVINTLENAIYMGVKNDISFMIDSRLNLFEHQSTVNPNMPTRYLIYVTSLVSGMVRNEELHSSRKKLLPLPEFVVFYNGVQKQPERQTMRLSELYMIPSEDPPLELKVKVLNINPGMNEELKKRCPKLAEYVEFVERLRKRVAAGDKYGVAVHDTVEECIRDGILKDYLLKNREGVTSMLLENYDEQAVRQVFREDGIAEGMEKGMAQGLEKGLEKGMDEGKIMSLTELMKNGQFSEERACELLGIFGDERTRLLRLMKEKAGQA